MTTIPFRMGHIKVLHFQAISLANDRGPHPLSKWDGDARFISGEISEA